VQLDLLGEAQVGVEQVREAVAAARPGFNYEVESAVAVLCPELYLPRFEMPHEGRQAKRHR
jgi:hypothetical protein